MRQLGHQDHFARTVTPRQCHQPAAPAQGLVDGLPANAPTEARRHHKHPRRPGFVPDVWMDSRVAQPGFKVTDPIPGYADLKQTAR